MYLLPSGIAVKEWTKSEWIKPRDTDAIEINFAKMMNIISVYYDTEEYKTRHATLTGITT